MMSVWIIPVCFLLFFFWEEITDPFKNFFRKKKENKDNVLAAERIALVKMLSDDPKDIEKFITSYVNVLSQKTINALVSRLEIIKNDKIIGDDSLKIRIDTLQQPQYDEEEVVTVDNVAKKCRSRKK